MFAEVKELLTYIEGNDYDAKIIAEIKACALDLTTSAEIVLPGIIAINRNAETGVVTDNSTVTDELIIKTIAVWCNKEIGNPPNYENLQASYNSLKGQMRLSKRYTHYGTQAPEDVDDGEATTE